ncbi:MAG: hypothetical protein AAFX50_12930 [Acidobacteriota bacterium]
MTRFENPWSSEEELADHVRAGLEAAGWRVYPETYGFDLFAYAVNPPQWLHGVKSGDTLAIECKLDAGTARGFAGLARQIAPSRSNIESRTGPHWRMAVSARIADAGLFEQLGVVPVELREKSLAQNPRPLFWRFFGSYRFESELAPEEPELLIDVPAGVPSPRSSGLWKINAVRLALRLRAGEVMTTAEIEAQGVSFGRARFMLEDSGRRRGRAYLWRMADVDGFAFDDRWPEIRDALRAKDKERGLGAAVPGERA